MVFSGVYFDKLTEENFNKLAPSKMYLVRRVGKKAHYVKAHNSVPILVLVS